MYSTIRISLEVTCRNTANLYLESRINGVQKYWSNFIKAVAKIRKTNTRTGICDHWHATTGMRLLACDHWRATTGMRTTVVQVCSASTCDAEYCHKKIMLLTTTNINTAQHIVPECRIFNSNLNNLNNQHSLNSGPGLGDFSLTKCIVKHNSNSYLVGQFTLGPFNYTEYGKSSRNDTSIFITLSVLTIYVPCHAVDHSRHCSIYLLSSSFT